MLKFNLLLQNTPHTTAPFESEIMSHRIQIISAPSILGLKPSGVQHLADSLLGLGLAEKTNALPEIINVAPHNHLYIMVRNPETQILNAHSLYAFSQELISRVGNVFDKKHFALVLGGDCSILLGIMPALKSRGNYGLVFIDAHADFYLPEQSITGEAADMDLALVTGKGPDLLTDINSMKPYVPEENVIHIGQRDWEETQHYGSEDIKKTAIKCHDLSKIRQYGIDTVLKNILEQIQEMEITGFWIHFDTDVIDDTLNPAVDYRLPGGLTFAEIEKIFSVLLDTGKADGMSVTIFNPNLDRDGSIGSDITNCLASAFRGFSS